MLIRTITKLTKKVFKVFDDCANKCSSFNMKAILLPILVAVISTVAARNLENVDPNTLSCDPEGQIPLHLPHFTDCNKFFMCTNGREVEFTCPGVTIFDFPLQVCNWPTATKCYLRERDIEGSGEEEFEMIETHNSPANSISGHDAVDSARPLPSGTPAKPSEFNTHLNCQRADSAAKRTAYKGDCQRYWRCVDGLPQTKYCNDGLFFNEATQQCDFEANVKCSDQIEDELKTEFIVYK